MKFYYIISLLVISIFTLQAQEMLSHEKKMYQSPEGKLYLNKDLPIYLWISNSPEESSKKARMFSEETPQYSNPMYLDTEGYNTVRSPSRVDTVTRKPIYPAQDIIFEIYADSEPPRLTLSYGGAKTYKQEGIVYAGSQAELEIIAKDVLSGVEQILYSVDGAAYKKYESTIKINEERLYTLKYYAVDNVGNVSEVKEYKITYDKTPPQTKISFDGDKHQDVLSGKTKITLEAEDKGIGLKQIWYQINEGKPALYKYPINTAYYKQGEYKLTYWSEDKVRNEENKKTYAFYIDKAPPTIIEEVDGKTFLANGREYSSGRAKLKLTAFDNKAGVKEIRYSINGGEFQTYEKPVTLTMASGNLVINSYAVDHVNNKSTSQTANQNTTVPYIDLTGPNLSQTFTGPKFKTRDTLFVNSKTKIILRAYDKESGVNRIDYQVGDGALSTYDAPFSIEDEGVHTISFTGYDNVENSSNGSFFVKVDNAGPVISHQFSTASNAKDTYPKYVILFLSATDNVVGLEKITYSINGTTTKTYSSPVKGFAKGDKKIKIKAYDKLNNSTEKEIEFKVE